MQKNKKSFKPSRSENLEEFSQKTIISLKLELKELRDQKKDIEFNIFDESDISDSDLFILDQIDDKIIFIEEEILKIEAQESSK